MATKLSPINSLADLKAEATRLWNSPPLNYYTPKITAFWHKYGYRVKLISSLLFVFLLVLFAINIGTNLSRQSRLPQVSPPPLPTVAPPTVVPISSQFLELRQQIQTFSTLLPDPAPPTVDEEISLQKSLKE